MLVLLFNLSICVSAVDHGGSGRGDADWGGDCLHPACGGK